MTRRTSTALATAIAAFAASAGQATAAAPGWTPPQDLGAVGSDFGAGSALASNDRGDAVAVITTGTSVLVARASANRAFAAPVRIAAANEGRPRVAIDERGVALLAFDYADGTHEATDFRDDDCCTGVKVSVWRPAHRPTTPRAVRRRGIPTTLGAIAATRGHRGVLVAGDEFGDPEPVRFVPVRIDGRLGTVRTVANTTWTPMTLQWVAGRAIAGLARAGDGRGTQIAVARQRRDQRFAAPHSFVKLTGQLGLSYYDSSLSALTMTPDGRGGQIAAYQRGKRPNLRIALSRKPLNGRVRTSTVRRGPARAVKLTPPVRARDGWIAFAWARRGGAPGYLETAYVTTRSPAGRLATAALASPATFASDLAVSVAPGGGGAVGVGTIVALQGTRAAILALAGGRPQPAGALDLGLSRATATSTVLSSNARDPARAVVQLGGRAFATRLAPSGE